MNNEESTLLKVSSATNVSKLAGAVTHLFEADEKRPIRLRAIGSGAINQAVKGIILTNKHLSKRAKICYLLPAFITLRESEEQPDKEVTAIEFHLKIQNL